MLVEEGPLLVDGEALVSFFLSKGGFNDFLAHSFPDTKIPSKSFFRGDFLGGPVIDSELPM